MRPGKSVRGEEDLVGAGRDAESPRRAGGHGSGVGSGLVADGGAGVGGNGNVNGIWRRNFPSVSKTWMRAVAAVGDVDIVLRVGGDAVRSVELAGLVAGFSQDFSQLPSLSAFGDAGIRTCLINGSVAGKPQNLATGTGGKR